MKLIDRILNHFGYVKPVVKGFEFAHQLHGLYDEDNYYVWFLRHDDKAYEGWVSRAPNRLPFEAGVPHFDYFKAREQASQ